MRYQGLAVISGRDPSPLLVENASPTVRDRPRALPSPPAAAAHRGGTLAAPRPRPRLADARTDRVPVARPRSFQCASAPCRDRSAPRAGPRQGRAHAGVRRWLLATSITGRT